MKSKEEISKNLKLKNWEKMLEKGILFKNLDVDLKNQGQSLKAYFRENEVYAGVGYTQATKFLKVAKNEEKMKALYDEGFTDLNKLLSEFKNRYQLNQGGGVSASGLKKIPLFKEKKILFFKVEEDATENEILLEKLKGLKKLKDQISTEISTIEQELDK